MSIRQISATALKTRIQNEDDCVDAGDTAARIEERAQQEQFADRLFLLDVREPNEFQYARIKNSVLIPLNQLPQRLDELNPQQEIVVICHHGVRSQQACIYLVNSGFENIVNLTGGIDAWSRECDSSVPRY